MHCVVCRMPIDSVFMHIFTEPISDRKGGVYVESIDKQHGGYLRSLERGSQEKCFCNGIVLDKQCQNCWFNYNKI